MMSRYANVLKTEDVLVCGLKAKMVIFDTNYYRYGTPKVFYLEESLKNLYDRTGIDCFEKIKANVPPQNTSRTVLDGFDGPIVPLLVDVEWYRTVQDEWKKLPDFNDSPIAEHYQHVSNWIGNMAFHDVPFTEDGKQGVLDCWGNELIPPMFEKCKPEELQAYLIPVRNGEKWGLAFRDGSNKDDVDFKYDQIDSWANYFIVYIQDKVGIVDPSGKVVIPVEMDDLTHLSFVGIFVTKKNNKYGFRFNNRKYIEPIVDEISFPTKKKRQRKYEPVRFRIGDDWFYLTEDGEWTNSLDVNTLKEYDLNMESLVHMGKI